MLLESRCVRRRSGSWVDENLRVAFEVSHHDRDRARPIRFGRIKDLDEQDVMLPRRQASQAFPNLSGGGNQKIRNDCNKASALVPIGDLLEGFLQMGGRPGGWLID